MKSIRLGMIVAGVLVVGGTVFVSSTFAGTDTKPGLHVIRNTAKGNIVDQVAKGVAPVQAASAAEDKVVLIAPPGELPVASHKMVTSLKPFAPVEQKQRVTAAGTSKVAKTVNVDAKASKAGIAVTAQAPASKPKNLFTLVRMLNYAPHPLTEELLKQAPLSMNGNNYWFSLKYDEDWKVLNDDEGYIKGISFEIDVMENNKKVRSLKTPKVTIDVAKVKKGQILGVAEVAPYKFTIKVEEVAKNKKGVSELVFKLDLLG